MNRELIRHFEPVTAEEQHILERMKHGVKQIEKDLYTSTKGFTVESKKMMQKTGVLIDIRPHTRFISFPKHSHNYIEILYMCSGRTKHIINGNIEVTLNTGDLLFLNQHSTHEVLPASIDDIGINFIVLPEFFDVAFGMLEKENVLSNFIISTLCHNANGSNYLHFKVADVLPVQNLVENLVWSIVYPQENDQEINQTTMGLLFMQLLNYTDTIEQVSPNQYKNSIVMKSLKYIEENYKEASLTELASRLNQSVSNLSKLIKEQTNFTFKELLQTKRLSQAERLLNNTKIPITDIIGAVGYDNTSYFYRIFREKYQMSPKDYRRYYQGKIRT